MNPRKHKMDPEDEPVAKRAKVSAPTCSQCKAALFEPAKAETKESESAAASAGTICEKCAAGELACTECKTKMNEESKHADGTCDACASTCSKCAEDDNLLFPRSKYPMTRRGELARVCHYCQRAGDSKEGDLPAVTCGKCAGDNKQFAVSDIIAHYQSEHVGFSAEELPVGFICCPACPRAESIKSGLVFLPVFAGRMDPRLIAHSQERHPMGVFADRFHDAVQQLKRQSERFRTDWARRIFFATTNGPVSAADNEALEQLLEATSRMEAAGERLEFA
jgi:hypothetical protein